jgi:dihydrofolate reductase
MNSVLLKGDVVDAVGEIRAESDMDVVVLGSGELLQSLMRANLVDEYVLLIHPLVLGSGQKLFRDGSCGADEACRHKVHVHWSGYCDIRA